VTYQWQFDGTNLPDGNGATLTVTNAQLPNQGEYLVLASNAFGTTTSSVATLTVYFTISVLVNGTGSVQTQPQASSFAANSSVAITAVTNAGFAFTGWSGDVSGIDNPVTAAMTTNLYITASFADSITNIVIDDTDPRVQFSGLWQSIRASGMYFVDCRSATCSPSATATVTFRPRIVVPGYYDVSIWCPWSSNCSSNAPWAITYSGGTLVTNLDERYRFGQWLPIGTELYFDEGTNGFVSLANATDESTNTIVIADAVRFLPSVSPHIMWNPQPQTARTGGNASFSVYVAGSSPFSYQWRLNGANVAGATSSTLALTQIQPSMAGGYTVVVSNLMGGTVSANAALTVTPPSAPHLLSAGHPANSQMQISLSGGPGVAFTIQTSSDLLNWTDLTNLMNVSGTTQFSDACPSNCPVRFYRATD